MFTPSNDKFLQAAEKEKVVQVLTLENFKYAEQEPIGSISFLGLAGPSHNTRLAVQEYDIPEDLVTSNSSEIFSLQPVFAQPSEQFDHNLNLFID